MENLSDCTDILIKTATRDDDALRVETCRVIGLK
jgi:hypothetical protein